MEKDENRIREVIGVFQGIDQLAGFARERSGWGDSDGGFGVIYPEDLDEYQREVEKLCIPDGQVEVYGFWGPPNGYQFLAMERFYLEILASMLESLGQRDSAQEVRELIPHCPTAPLA
ncbi:hypothetical protein [Pseudomonas purpurea]|uniref:hypothetical protein n=1 Tax=Pseudomonas purpurea TaxID=3136737 RepID=UPI0032657541